MLLDLLGAAGITIGRQAVAHPMRRMGIEAPYRRLGRAAPALRDTAAGARRAYHQAGKPPIGAEAP